MRRSQLSGNRGWRGSITRERLLAAAALILLSGGTIKLGSESMTLTTYYPSPLGIYKSLTSTQQSIFARDAGNVGIGVAAPANKLHVAGVAAADDFCLNDGSACLGKSKNVAAMTATSVPVAWAGGAAGGCEGSFACTDWMDVPGGTLGPMKIQGATNVLLTFTGNYNCNYCYYTDRTYMQARMLVSKDGGGFAPVYTGGAIYVDNAGADMAKRASVALAPGTYSFKLQHKLSVYNPDPQYNMWLVEGLFSAER